MRAQAGPADLGGVPAPQNSWRTRPADLETLPTFHGPAREATTADELTITTLMGQPLADTVARPPFAHLVHAVAGLGRTPGTAEPLSDGGVPMQAPLLVRVLRTNGFEAESLGDQDCVHVSTL